MPFETDIGRSIEMELENRAGQRVVVFRGSSGVLVGVLCLFVTCTINTLPSESISLSPVYWNLSNPIFKSSKNDHIIFVNPFDEIDFVCPYYAPLSTTTETNHSSMEFYLIYQVSKPEYDSCIVFSETDSSIGGGGGGSGGSGGGGHRLLLSCTQPTQRRRFTIWFDPFQSVPRVPEYKPRHSYYFITTSTGHHDGLRNLHHGACHGHNMKLTIRIGDIVHNDDDVDERTDDDVIRNSDRIRNSERTDDDDDDDGFIRQPLPRHQQRRTQFHHTKRPTLRHEKGLPLNSSSSSSSSSSFVYSRRNLSRHLPMLSSSSRSSTDSLPPPSTSGVPRDLMGQTHDDVGRRGQKSTEVKDRSEEYSRAVHLQQNLKSTFDLRSRNEASNSPLSSASPPPPLDILPNWFFSFHSCLIVSLYVTIKQQLLFVVREFR